MFWSMAKPTNLLLETLKVRVPNMAEELDGLVSFFEKSYQFRPGSTQDEIDDAFAAFFVGATHMKTLEKLRNMGCGPVRCATCDGKCGK